MTARALAAGLAALLSGCAATAGARAGGPPDPEKLYRAHCGSCHRLRLPAEHTRARWAWAVERFGGRAHLDPEERAAVLAWLQARAADGPAGANAGSASH